jgi:hypothetical protein
MNRNRVINRLSQRLVITGRPALNARQAKGSVLGQGVLELFLSLHQRQYYQQSTGVPGLGFNGHHYKPGFKRQILSLWLA